MSDEVEITESCGCVFCDLGLDPHPKSGRLVHFAKEGEVACTRPTASIVNLAERRR